MNTAVLKMNWFTAFTAWLRGSARPKAKVARAAGDAKPRMRIAGLR